MSDDPRTWSGYRLASEADCVSPDSNDSPGCKMLESVRDAVIDAFDYNDQDVSDEAANDIVTEAADGGPDVYTHAMWSEFVDLCAYREDPTDLGFDGSDMEQGTRYCLYMIAERCARAVMDALRETSDSEELAETR